MSFVASQSIPSWNQIISWLKEMETLRQKYALIAYRPRLNRPSRAVIISPRMYWNQEIALGA